MSGTSLGFFSQWGHRSTILWNGEYPSPLFLPLWQRKEWDKSRIDSQWGHCSTMIWNGEYPWPLLYPFGREGSRGSLGLVPDEIIVPGRFGIGGIPHLYFFTLRPRREWSKPRIGSRWGHCPLMLWNRGYSSPLFFLPFDREGSGASLGLVPHEVTVLGCFGTNRKVSKCHPRPITSLYILRRVLSANICFCNRKDRGKTSKLLTYSRYSPTC